MRTLKGPDHAFRMVKNIYRLIKHKKMIEMKKQVTPGETPEQITISMIDQDLKDGINKSEMAIKYGIKPWEVDEMFKHPLLKGRRPSRKKVLSFTFVDDMTTDTTEEVIVDPNQITLEQAIDEAIEGVGEVRNQMQETQDAIIDMLSPTQFETPEETIAKVNGPEITGIPSRRDPDDELGVCEETGATEYDGEEIDDDYVAEKDAQTWEEKELKYTPDGNYEEEDEVKLPSFEDTLDIVKEQQEEEEIEMDDDTFEL